MSNSPTSCAKPDRLELDKRALASRFGCRVNSYEAATPVQHTMGQFLLDTVRRETCAADIREILEIGCGTGRLTRALNALFPAANITAVDISPEMIGFAAQALPGPSYLVADAEDYLQSLTTQFDLIISNATVQWFVDLDKSIERMCSALTPDGLLALGTFGERTFYELADAFNRAYEKNDLPFQNHLVPMKSVDYLQRLLPQATVMERDIRSHFANVRAFLQSIKDAGAVNSQVGHKPIPRGVLRDMPHFYRSHHTKPGSSDIQATYHACFMFYHRSDH